MGPASKFTNLGRHIQRCVMSKKKEIIGFYVRNSEKWINPHSLKLLELIFPFESGNATSCLSLEKQNEDNSVAGHVVQYM